MERKWYRYRTMVQLNGGEECVVDYTSKYYYLSEEEKEKLTRTRQFYNFEYAKVCARRIVWGIIWSISQKLGIVKKKKLVLD